MRRSWKRAGTVLVLRRHRNDNTDHPTRHNQLKGSMRVSNQAKIMTAQDIITWCSDYISGALDVPIGSIDPTREFDALGLDSAVITSMLIELEEWLGIDIPPSIFFSQSTLSAMGNALSTRVAKEGSDT